MFLKLLKWIVGLIFLFMFLATVISLLSMAYLHIKAFILGHTIN